jgi:hypothetical protein
VGYSNYKKIKQVRDTLKVRIVAANLFEGLPILPIEPSEWLRVSLKRAYTTPPNNEKAKSERLVSPVLLEAQAAFETTIGFFSGEEININAEENLAGPCDFFFALATPSIVLEAPIISIVEAKDEDLEWGLAQCAAQVYAASLYNKAENKDLPILYGCATTGVEWQFFKFENNTFHIDRIPMTNLPQVLGTWHWILGFYVENYTVKI